MGLRHTSSQLSVRMRVILHYSRCYTQSVSSGVVQKLEDLWIEVFAIDNRPVSAIEAKCLRKVRGKLVKRRSVDLSKHFPPHLSNGISIGSYIISKTFIPIIVSRTNQKCSTISANRLLLDAKE